ncbi:MAG: cytochrome c [Chitinophagales bacterium]
MKKIVVICLLISGMIYVSCTKSSGAKSTTKAAAVPELPGKSVFDTNCRICHGSKGDLGVSGAANLRITALTVDEKVQVITNGRKAMPSWKEQLSPEQIRQVAEYTETLKN